MFAQHIAEHPFARLLNAMRHNRLNLDDLRRRFPCPAKLIAQVAHPGQL